MEPNEEVLQMVKEGIPDLKPETIARFKELYITYKDLIDFREEYGNLFEKAEAMLIKYVALNS